MKLFDFYNVVTTITFPPFDLHWGSGFSIVFEQLWSNFQGILFCATFLSFQVVFESERVHE
jgi:hypothetical protein